MRDSAIVPTDEISDAALAQRIARGADEAAEAELCRRFAGRIRLYGRRHLGSDAMADDLVQHVLVLAIESLREGRVREPERLASFILGSCRMVTRDARRAAARREHLLERFGISVDVDAERPAELDLQRLRSCIEKLPSRERTIVLLTFYADRRGEEIASELSMTLGNVRVVRRRAVEHLQACMGDGKVDQ